MQFIDDDGKIGGKINLFDFVICMFLLSIFVTLVVYVYFPPRVNEHNPLDFQVYYKDTPRGTLDLFQVGNGLLVHNKGDRAIVSAVKQLPCKDAVSCDILVTYNGTLEIGSDGQYLFNDFEITPGRELYGQINNFFVYGVVYRINLTNITTTKLLTLSVRDESLINITNITGELYNSIDNTYLGNLLSVTSDFGYSNLTGTFILDVYNDALYLQESSLVQVGSQLGLDTQYGFILGTVIKIEDAPQEGENY